MYIYIYAHVTFARNRREPCVNLKIQEKTGRPSHGFPPSRCWHPRWSQRLPASRFEQRRSLEFQAQLPGWWAKWLATGYALVEYAYVHIYT